MDTVTQYFRGVFSITYIVFDWFKRLIWRKGSYRDRESLLPVTVDTNTNKSAQFNYSSSSIVNSYNTNIGNNWNLINNRHSTNNTQTNQNEEQEPEINYFEDMQPSKLKQKKVYISSNASSSPAIETNYSNQQSDRLNFDTKNVYQSTGELGFLEETANWEDDLDADNIDSNVKMMRQADIERRIAEHKRIKIERELKKNKNKANFMATKIS